MHKKLGLKENYLTLERFGISERAPCTYDQKTHSVQIKQASS